MRILAVAGGYPFPGYVFSGIFNERCVLALRELGEDVVVLSPRPYVPAILALRPRWRAYATIPAFENRSGVDVYRPALLRVPSVGGPMWSDVGAYLCSRRTAGRLHRACRFDAIMSFDLLGAGGLAWRLGRLLGLPASGWAFGGDVRPAALSSEDRVLYRTLTKLNCVFYQSGELLQCAEQCVRRYAGELSAGRHVVLPHGIPDPPPRPDVGRLREIRRRLELPTDRLIVLSLGRITQAKGADDLLDAFAIAASHNDALHLMLVGAVPGFDDSEAIAARIQNDARLRGRVMIRPACSPDQVWEYYYSADIFAFASRMEGMPNALLEGMAAGVPAVAFGIPAVREIDAGGDCLLTIRPRDCEGFAQAMLRLGQSTELRSELGSRGRRVVASRFNVRLNMARACEVLRQAVSGGAPASETDSIL